MQHVTHTGQKFWQENLKKRDQLENCNVGGRMWTRLN